MIQRANAALVAMDPLVLLLRASLLVLLVNSNNDPLVFVGVAVTCAIALPRPAVLQSPWLWAGLFLVVGAGQLSSWHSVDDHIIVTTYWCGALALGLTATDARRTLAASARLLIGAVFAFAAGWKLGSGEFIDGSFFRYSLLFDDRFETVARVLGGTTEAMRRANLGGLNALAADPQIGGEILLQEGPRNVAVAQVSTWWGVLVEALVALAFLVPLRRRWEVLRPVALAAFAGTTYLIVPVGGFGVMLLVLGSAQASSDRLRIGYLWAAIGLLVWAGIWPHVFL